MWQKRVAIWKGLNFYLNAKCSADCWRNMIRAIVTDIEGTTSDIRFVHNVLFPYARERLPAFLNAQQYIEPVKTILDNLREEIAQPMPPPPICSIRLCSLWMRTVNPRQKRYRALSGAMATSMATLPVIFTRTYCPRWKNGKPKALIFMFIPLAQWQRKNCYLATATKVILLICSAATSIPTGAKREVQSYRNIAEQLGVPPGQILFLSDIHQELDAAAQAGLRTIQLIRGDHDAASHHHQVPSFDHIKPEQIPS
jgi:enolase-phosphatase E1